MKGLKIVSLLILALNFTQCKTMKMTMNPPFKVTGATYNNWVGGQPGISGIKVIIRVDFGSDIIFDRLYFNKKITTIQRRSINDKQYIIGHIDTSNRKNIIAIEENSIEKKESIKAESEKFPFLLKENEAVISYKKGDKIFYYKVFNIKKTKTVMYP